jgi:hypothetical protein
VTETRPVTEGKNLYQDEAFLNGILKETMPVFGLICALSVEQMTDRYAGDLFIKHFFPRGWRSL